MKAMGELFRKNMVAIGQFGGINPFGIQYASIIV